MTLSPASELPRFYPSPYVYLPMDGTRYIWGSTNYMCGVREIRSRTRRTSHRTYMPKK